MAKEKFDKSLADFNYNTQAYEKYKAAIRRQRSTERLGDKFVQGFDLLKRAGLAIRDTAFPDPSKAKYRTVKNPDGLGTKLVEKQRPNYNPSDYGLRRTKAGEQTWQDNMFGGNKSQLKLTQSEATQQPEAPVAPPQGENTAQAAVTTPTRDLKMNTAQTVAAGKDPMMVWARANQAMIKKSGTKKQKKILNQALMVGTRKGNRVYQDANEGFA
jgi:hypothetical protein